VDCADVASAALVVAASMADTLCGIHSSCPWLTAQLLVLVVVAVDVVDVIVVASHL